MKKKILILPALLITGALMITGCSSLKTMKKNADKISYTVVPEVLETHAGKVDATIQSQFPAKYFAKKATLTVTPVLKYAEGETALTPYVLQGEKVKANNKVISYQTGGSNSVKGSVPYNKDMQRSNLELRIKASQGAKSVDFKTVTVAKGVISTSTLVDNSPLAISGLVKKANTTGIYDPTIDKYQRIVPDAYMADLVYLINSAEVRSKELTKAEIAHLNKYIVDAYSAESKELKGVEISAYASPDGGMELNSKLAGKREGSATSVVENDLKKNKVKADLTTKNTPEDWEGFKALMEKSNIQDKDLILRVLAMYSDPEVREREIKNLSSAFTKVADEILPQLRRAKITANVNLVGRTDAEISKLAATDPSKLNQAELLYAASLTNDLSKQKAIYTSFTKIFSDDWRGYNNLGYVEMNEGDFAAAAANFQKADQADPKNPIVQNNLGCVALKNGDWAKAEVFFGAASGAGKEVKENLGILKIKQGDYDTAVKYLGEGSTSYANRALAQLLNGDNNGALKTLNAAPVESGRIAYLKAIVAARTAKTGLMYESLVNAIKKDPAYGVIAQNDLEFAKYANEQNFKLLFK
jgi:tetratricopeptide (TPR) repeat protein